MITWVWKKWFAIKR